MDWTEQLRERIAPASEVHLPLGTLVGALAAALLIVATPAIWRWVRIAVTLVHELGHAIVGMALGRRFSGMVLRSDMSGHAVTVGKPRGPARVLSTWAGYPAPAVIGAAMIWLALRGWAAPVLTVILVVLLIATIRIRSALTAVVVLMALAATAALWWWGTDAVQAPVLVGVGAVLLVGAWRHVFAVARTRDRASDVGQLAALTKVPRVLWLASFVLVCAAATGLAAQSVWAAAR